MKIVKMRCTGCNSTPTFLNQELDVCREKVCERCQIKLTVVSSEGQVDVPPMPDRERVTQHKDVTRKEADTARRLLVTAFGTGRE